MKTKTTHTEHRIVFKLMIFLVLLS